MDADLVVVGAGLSGLTVAERCAGRGARVVVVDRRDHIGGNARSCADPGTGIEVHRYGAHLFHTSDERVWEYVNRFTSFTSYVHRVRTVHAGEVYPMPVCLATINQLFRSAMSPAQARALVAQQAAEMAGRTPTNLDEQGVALVGRPLYEAFVRGYTAKQWQTDPRDLPPEVITRLPVRFDYDDRYFSDTHQGLPVAGYAAWFERMADHPGIEVLLGVDFLDPGASVSRACTAGRVPVVFTGPVDRYFGRSAGALGWRTLDFDTETVATGDFQGIAVMNYADEDVPWTRVLEFRHLHPERPYPDDATVIARERSRAAGPDDEPYYPIGTAQDRDRLAAYRQMAADEPATVFLGRLGRYQYLDMHQAVAAALDAADGPVADLLTPRNVLARH